MTTTRAAVLSATMCPRMQQDAVDIAGAAMDRYYLEKDVASYITRKFKKLYPGTWQCIVGSEFGSSVTFDTCFSIHFILGNFGVILFRSEDK